jgi:hypothetical protein
LGVLWISRKLRQHGNVLDRAFSPAAFPHPYDCRLDLLEPFAAFLDRAAPDLNESIHRIQTKETITIMGANLTLIALCGLSMWIYSYRIGLFETGAITHPIAVELVGPVFPLLVFMFSLVVTLWTAVLGDKLWWGAFATPFLVHLARRTRSPAKIQPEKTAHDA